MSNFYENVNKNYCENNYFTEKTIEIKYYSEVASQDGYNRFYRITEVHPSNYEKSKEKNVSDLDTFCKTLLEGEKFHRSWQLFYLYKELFQYFINEREYNYFRGQSDNYTLKPGILRDDINSSYRKDFEKIYKKIANEFPDKIKYYELSDTDKRGERAYQLSLLQHYGLRTSLLDITKNPYIALLFMLSDSFSNYKEPVLYLFKIDETDHTESHLFTEVMKNNLNERIIAQKGAFFSFDKLYENNFYNTCKIESIKLILKFDEDGYKRYILEEIEKIENETNGSSEYLLRLQKALHNIDANIENEKGLCLKNIKNELSQKLREYYYFEEDLFPDFEKKLQYLSNQYKKNLDDKEYSGETYLNGIIV